jgi:hypothetical protein
MGSQDKAKRNYRGHHFEFMDDGLFEVYGTRILHRCVFAFWPLPFLFSLCGVSILFFLALEVDHAQELVADVLPMTAKA